MVKFIELFCGIGGFRLGIERCGTKDISPEIQSGRKEQTNQAIGGKGRQFGELTNRYRNGFFDCVWANDSDKYACQIYRRHWNDGTLHEGDIRTTDADTIPEHDLLCAGFPCQDFSIAGRRAGIEGARGTLFREICRVLRAKKPGYVFLENVKGLLSADNGRAFGIILTSLDELGYDCQWQVLNSKDFGVPQNRERVFIIGHLRGQPRPKVFPLREVDTVYPEPDGQISHTIDSNYHEGWLDHGQRTMIIHENKSGIQTPHSEAQALRSGASHNYQTVNRIRRLTPLECERLQGFPDGWTEGISDTQRHKCLGNAVTVTVIEAIGRVIRCQNYLEV